MIFTSQKNYKSMVEKKLQFTSYPAAKHLNTANLPLQTCEKNQWTFLLYDTGVGFNPQNNFANSIAKVSIPVQLIIPR